MLSLDQGSQISVYVEQALIAWIRLYPSFQSLNDITQLANGKFFLALLETLPNFKLLHPLPQIEQQNSLAAKVTIIKNISKSLNHYHQTQMLRDVSEFDINYVELCMGNKKQLLRLITILLSALCSQVSSRVALQQCIQRLNYEQSEVLKIMIENSVNLGQQCGSCSSRSWRLSQQKKVFAKMQTLQNKIQQLQILNKNLQEIMKLQKQSQESTNQQNKKLKQQIKRLLILNDELVQSNEKAINQLKLSTIDETTAKKKFQIMKSKLQQKVSKLQHQLQRMYPFIHENNILKQKLQNISQINNQIKEQNTNLRQQLAKYEVENQELKNIEKMHKKQFICLKEHCSSLEIKIEELMIACNNMKTSSGEMEGGSYYKTCYFGNFDIENSGESNRYRLSQNLGWLNCDKENEGNSSQKKIRNSNCFEIRTITERSLQDSLCLQNMKQNQSLIINSSQVSMPNPSFSKPHQTSQNPPLHSSLSQKLQKSQQLSSSQQYEKLEKQYMEQIRVLTCVILDLQTQLQQANKRNPIYITNDSIAKSRMQKFKAKVKQMFSKGQSVVQVK